MPATLPPDLDGDNGYRAALASTALRGYIRDTRCDDEDAIADLITSLMHYADRHDINFDAQLRQAENNYAVDTWANINEA